MRQTIINAPLLNRSVKWKREREQKDLARARILQLFEEAKKRFFQEPALSNRYVVLARKIAMKMRLHMPKEVKHSFCKHCHSFLSVGHNVRIRLQKHHVAMTCLVCNRTMRHPYVREQKKKRALVKPVMKAGFIQK
ncbi:ribonuclease P [Candidatus Woesearchaeota archaeon]|nr:ribonuclease P [Candidatus Woesearchaeota archaeon]